MPFRPLFTSTTSVCFDKWHEIYLFTPDSHEGLDNLSIWKKKNKQQQKQQATHIYGSMHYRDLGTI